MTYELFCQSVKGASHIRKNIPCQDYGKKKDCGEYKIFATADGHGDPRCIRSDIGSRKICEIAIEDLETFAGTVREQGWEDKLFHPQEKERLVRQLAKCMVGKWIEAVGEEYESNPPTEAKKQRHEAGSRVERMYGTTLIAGLQTEQYLLLLQQGDGRCVVFYGDGSADQPIPWDDSCVGNATTSLCDIDAAQSFRFHVIDLKETPVIACIAGTDGVEDSFPSSMEKTHAYYRGLLRDACEKGVPALEEALAKDLSDLSANGSADDVTVSGIVDVERVRPLLRAFEESNRLVELEDTVAALESKLNSIREGGKLQHLQKECEQTLLREKEALSRKEAAKKRCEKAKEELQIAEGQVAVARQNCQKIGQEHQAKEEQYEAKAKRCKQIREDRQNVAKRYQAAQGNSNRISNPKEFLEKIKCEFDEDYRRLTTELNKLRGEMKEIQEQAAQKKKWMEYRNRQLEKAKENLELKKEDMDFAEEGYESAQEESIRATQKKQAAKSELESYQKRNADIQLKRDNAKKELEDFRKPKN